MKIFHICSLVGIVCGLQFQKYHPYVSSLDFQNLLILNQSEELKVSDVTGAIYSETFSFLHQMKKLTILTSIVDEIEEQAFCASPFQEIELSSNWRFPKLSKKHFGDCPTLLRLKLVYNDGMVLEETVFGGLKNLEKLEIIGLEIGHLSKNHFQNLAALEDLGIISCKTETIEDGTFESTKNLTKLRLQRNKIVRIDGILTKLSHLKGLYLDYNKLRAFPWHDLNYTPKLEVLSITSNEISSYDVEEIVEHCPKLQEFYFRSNFFACKRTKGILKDLRAAFKDLVTDYRMSDLRYCRS